MKILITGGAGFIGSHLTDALVDRNHDVVIVDNLVNGKRANINCKARFYNLDILDRQLEAVIKSEAPDVVYHLAAIHDGGDPIHTSSEMDSVNIMGTMKILDYCVEETVSKIIYASTIDVYGNPMKSIIDENEVLVPKTEYALSKYIPEKYVKAYGNKYNLNYSILRIANVYGNRMTNKGEGNRVLNIIKKDNHTPRENLIKDFIYIKDVVTMLVKVLEVREKEIYNVGTGASYKMAKHEVFQIRNSYLKEVKTLKVDKALSKLDFKAYFDLDTGLEDMNYKVNIMTM